MVMDSPYAPMRRRRRQNQPDDRGPTPGLGYGAGGRFGFGRRRRGQTPPWNPNPNAPGGGGRGTPPLPGQTPPWNPNGPSGGGGGGYDPMAKLAGPGGPGGGAPNVPGPTQWPGGGGGGGGGDRNRIGGLPLDAIYEAQRRALDDQFQSSLDVLGPLREQIRAQQQLALARMETNRGYDTDAMMNDLAARGIVGSGIQAGDEADLATRYLRMTQDLGTATGGALSDVASQRGDLRGDYRNQLAELLLQLAQRSAQSPYTPRRGRR